MEKTLFSIISISINIVALTYYVRSILKKETEPHIFTWGIWSITMLIVFFAQLSDGAGVGAWPTGVSAAFALTIVMLTYRQENNLHITKPDWVILSIALGCLPLWLVTSTPLPTVIILTVVDLFGYAPTFRKSYHSPQKEPIFTFIMGSAAMVAAIFALEHYSVTTALFPAAILMANLSLVTMIVIRKNAVGAKNAMDG